MDRECFACQIPLIKSEGEDHHVVPQQFGGGGGANIVRLCGACHDFIDRRRFQSISDCSWFMREAAAQPGPRWARLMMLETIKIAAYAKSLHDGGAEERREGKAKPEEKRRAKTAKPKDGLLPCPFCGSIPKILYIDDRPSEVVCHTCHAHQTNLSVYGEYGRIHGPLKALQKQWNQRQGSVMRDDADGQTCDKGGDS